MKRLFSLALAWVSVAAFAQITYTDYSGSIASGGVSQTLAAASNGRVRIAILNPATETENLCVNLTTAASCTPGSSWILQSGQSIVIDSTEAVTVVAATTGHKWIAKAGVGAGFAANGGGSGGGGGAVTIADGANVTLGAKTDAKSTATDATSVTAMQVLKQISASVQAPPSQAVTNAGTFATQSAITAAASSIAAGAAVDGSDLTRGAKADAVCATDTGTCSQIALEKKIAANLTTLAGTNAQLPTALGTGADSAGLLTTWTTEGKAQLGSLTETAPASDTASSGLNGRLQRVAQNITTLNGKFTATANADANRAPVSLDIASPVTGSAAAAGVLSGMPFAIGKGAQSIIVDVTANTATSAVFEASADGTTAYQAILCYQSTATGAGSRASSTATTGKWECPSWGTHFQVRQTGAGGVTATVTPIARPVPSVTPTYVANTPNVLGPASQGSSVSPYPFGQGLEARTTTGTAVTNGQVVRAIGTTDGKPAVLIGSVPELSWTYAAAASGIVNTTTAVTIKAAGTDRLYLTRLDLMCEALGAATEVAVRDGAAGTVLWRTKVGTGGLPLTNINFATPLKGTSATLLEVVTLTASVTGACYFNAAGYDAK